MVDSHIADGDVVLMEPVQDPQRLRNGTVVSALVAGSTTLGISIVKTTVVLEAANPAYQPLNSAEQVEVQGRWLPSGVRSEALAV